MSDTLLPPAPTIVTTADEDADAVRAWLDELGMTLDELRAEAEVGAFRSEQAANAWFFIQDLA